MNGFWMEERCLGGFDWIERTYMYSLSLANVPAGQITFLLLASSGYMSFLQIFPYLKSNPRMADPKIKELRSRLDSFYNSTTEYPAFLAEPDQSVWLRLLEPYIDELLRKHGKIRILEYGAGRSGFSKLYNNRMNKIEFHVQDVTSSNREYLEKVADRVHINDVSEIKDYFHLIFSTFVLEHIATPEEFLTEIDRLLVPGGIHAIFSPRYDFPGYVCPSLRHLKMFSRFLVCSFIILSRIVSRILGKTKFWVNCDPSVFHGHWYRDADAVHIVSRGDIERWHRRHRFKVEMLKPSAVGWRDYICKRLMTQSIVAIKPEK